MTERAHQRAFPTVFSADLARARAFYVSLFELEVAFDSDWFVHLRAPGDEQLELGLLRRDHDIVPPPLRAAPAGAMWTLVVADVDAVHDRARAQGADILEAPRDLFYGQRRMLVRDPDGFVVDVSSECAPDPAWLATLK